MKRTVTSLFALALVGAFSLIGCGDDTNNTTGGNTVTPIALDELGTKTAEAFCEQVYACCTTDELDQVFDNLNPQPTNEAECVQTFKGFYDGFVLPDLKEAVAAGRMDYDGALAASCYSAVDCSTFDAPPSAECDKIFVGKVADGGECGGDDECAGADSVCVGDTDMALGKCQARGAIGAACSFDDDCISDYCSFSSSMCEERKALGEACTGFDCKDSYCDGMTNVCTAKKADGVACTSFDECESDDCDSMTNTCVAEPGPICDGM